MPPKKKSSKNSLTKNKEAVTCTSSEYKETAENKITMKKNRRNSKKQQEKRKEKDPYEGDVESTGSSTVSAVSPSSSLSSNSNMSVSQIDALKAYEFDEPDTETVVSVSKKNNKSLTSSGKTSRVNRKKPKSSLMSPLRHTRNSDLASTPNVNQCMAEVSSESGDSASKVHPQKRKLRKKTPLSPIPLNMSSPTDVETLNVSSNTRSSKKKQVTIDDTLSFCSTDSKELKSPLIFSENMELDSVNGYESFQKLLQKSKTPSNTKLLKSTKKSTPKLKESEISNIEDSGVYSPSPVVVLSKKSTALTSRKTVETSTPSNLRKRKTVDSNTSCFGFSDMETGTGLEGSCIKKPKSMDSKELESGMLSDYESMEAPTFAENTPSKQSIELFSMEDEDFSLNRSSQKIYGGKSKTQKTYKKSSKNVKEKEYTDLWNNEFDEIEKFQLSIEDA